MINGRDSDLIQKSCSPQFWKPELKQKKQVWTELSGKSESIGCPALQSESERSESKVRKIPSCKTTDWKARPFQRNPLPAKL